MYFIILTLNFVLYHILLPSEYAVLRNEVVKVVMDVRDNNERVFGFIELNNNSNYLNNYYLIK